jgi:hypothetical protein
LKALDVRLLGQLDFASGCSLVIVFFDSLQLPMHCE